MPKSGPLGDFDLDESEDAPPVSEQIIAALTANSGKVIDLFRSWDENGDGKVTRAEFHKAMKELGLRVTKDSIDSIFTRWDKDGGGELSLPEMSKILRMAATSAKGIEEMRKMLVKKGLKLTALFREWDTDGDGEINREEFAHALRYIGLKYPKEQVDALFDSFDRDGSGLIDQREFNKMLRRDIKAEETARRERTEAARIAREKAEHVDPIESEELRRKIRSDLAVYTDASPGVGVDKTSVTFDTAAPPNAAGISSPTSPDAPTGLLPAQTILSAKEKAHEKRRLHFQLRLRGTDAELPEAQLTRSVSGTFAEMAREVTRHSRRPRLDENHRKALPKLIDVLSMHRPRSHCPARRHVHVLQAPAPTKLSREQLTALKMPTVERALQRREKMRTSQSTPNFGLGLTSNRSRVSVHVGSAVSFEEQGELLRDAVASGRILTTEELERLRETADEDLMTGVATGRMLSNEELGRLKEMADDDLMAGVASGRMLSEAELERLKEMADEDLMAAVQSGRMLTDDELIRLKASADEELLSAVAAGRILTGEELTRLKEVASPIRGLG